MSLREHDCDWPQNPELQQEALAQETVPHPPAPFHASVQALASGQKTASTLGHLRGEFLLGPLPAQGIKVSRTEAGVCGAQHLGVVQVSEKKWWGPSWVSRAQPISHRDHQTVRELPPGLQWGVRTAASPGGRCSRKSHPSTAALWLSDSPDFQARPLGPAPSPNVCSRGGPGQQAPWPESVLERRRGARSGHQVPVGKGGSE